jgi:hypothetical protein
MPLCRLDLLVVEFHGKQLKGRDEIDRVQGQLHDALRARCPLTRTVLDPENYWCPPYRPGCTQMVGPPWKRPLEYTPEVLRRVVDAREADTYNKPTV